MATRHLAQGLASLGRNGDSMLVHMQPREVAGLQALARSHGTSLTINPDTGMPEAFSLGGIFRAALPIAAGFALGPGGFGLFDSALTAGLAVGAGAYALTGSPTQALSWGLGAYGGAGLGSNLAGFGKDTLVSKVASTPEIMKVGTDMASTAGIGSDIIKTPAIDAIAGGATGTATIPKIGMVMPTSAIDATAAAAPSGFDASMAGVNRLTQSGGFGAYGDYLKSIGKSPWGDAFTVGMPILSGMSQQPRGQLPSVADATWDYKGPYRMPDRQVRYPTAEERLQMAAQGSPEYNYFGVSNPVPGYLPYAEGGSISTGGIRDLYGSPDDQTNGAVLSQDGFGLGRLQAMYGGGMAEGFAGGGPISFDAGGQIPSIPEVPYGGPSAAMEGLGAVLSNAINDPLGRVQGGAPQNPAGEALATMATPQAQPQGGLPNPTQMQTAPAVAAPTMAQPVQAAAHGGIMSLAKGGRPSSGGYLDGPGDGMSDSIPATIAGKQPARLADGEFVVPADVVSHLGNGSTKAGAKHLYKMMDRVRQARTGTKKQGRQINPNKLMPA